MLETKAKKIKEMHGDGFVGNWHIQWLRVCPKCGKIPGGWKGSEGGLICRNCNAEISWDEWLNLETKARWRFYGEE